MRMVEHVSKAVNRYSIPAKARCDVRRLMTGGVLLLTGVVVAGQPALKFEIASVKPNKSGETRIRFETPPGRITAVNVPLRFAIRQAWRIPESRIVGGPAWLDTDRFDI